MKKILVLAAMVLLPFGANADAAIIALTDAGIVGIQDFNGATDPNNPATRLIYANALIGMTANASQPAPYPANGSEEIGYKTGPTDYTGSFAEAPTVTGTNVVPAGSQYVLAKYDGPNGGYILFNIPDWGSTTIPQTAGYINWDNQYNKDGSFKDYKEYGLSGYTVYGQTVPDGGSAAMLLGAALVGLAGVRRILM